MSSPRTHRNHVRVAADLAGFLAIIMLAWYLWPASLGGDARIVVVQGHSMEPTFQLGDALIVKANPRPHVGDIIVFHIPAGEPAAGKMVVHRVRAIRADGSYQTQGDNRTTADSFHTTDGDVMGSPVRSIPHLGRVIGLASNPIAVGLATGLIATMLLWPAPLISKDEGDSPEASVHDFDAEAQAWLDAELSWFTLEADVGSRVAVP